MATLEHYVKIGNTILPKVSKYDVEWNKLWTNATRSMSGKLTASLIGTFPKLVIEFTLLTRAEMKTLINLISPATLTVQYWNEATETYKTAQYYAGDFKYSILNKQVGRYDRTTLVLIPYAKQT